MYDGDGIYGVIGIVYGRIADGVYVPVVEVMFYESDEEDYWGCRAQMMGVNRG